MRVIYGRGGIDEKGTGQYHVTWGRDGAAACERALSDSRLANWWMRRGSLRRAEAMHLIAAGESERSEPILASLESEVSASRNGLYRSSMSSSLTLIRAWLALDRKQPDSARALAQNLIADRPYSAFVRRAASRILVAADPNWAAVEKTMKDSAPVDSHEMAAMFMIAAVDSDFARLVELDHEIVLTSPSQRKDWSYDAGLINEGMALAEYGGHAAYALSALGRPSDAEARLQLADAQIGDFAERTKKTAFGASPKDRVIRQKVAALARDQLAKWREVIALRGSVKGIGIDQLVSRAKGKLPRKFYFAGDLRRLALDGAVGTAPATTDGSSAKEELAKLFGQVGITELADALPAVEYESGQVKIGNAENWLLSMPNGLTFTDEPSGDLTVRYSMGGLGQATAQEFAMLGAARKVRSLGHSGFIILNEQTLPRVMQDCTMGLACTRSLLGYEAQLLILPVDLGHIPAGYQQYGWRVLDAGKVQSALESYYAMAFAPHTS